MKKRVYSEINWKATNRKVTKKMANSMAKRVAKGETYTSIAERFGVSPNAVRYNTDMDYRQNDIEKCW